MRNKAEDFSKIEEMLAYADAGERERRDRIRRRVMSRMSQEAPRFKCEASAARGKKRMRLPVAAACALLIIALLGALSTTALAEDLISNVLAYFKIGNFDIVRYDHIPDYEPLPTKDEKQANPVEDTVREITLEDAYSEIGMQFKVPTRLPKGYRYVKCVSYGSATVSVQYRSDADVPGFNQLSILITNQKLSSQNGVETERDIETAEIDGMTVYYVNGIFIWLMGDLRYELYWPDYNPDKDMDSVREIIESIEVYK